MLRALAGCRARASWARSPASAATCANALAMDLDLSGSRGNYFPATEVFAAHRRSHGQSCRAAESARRKYAPRSHARRDAFVRAEFYTRLSHKNINRGRIPPAPSTRSEISTAEASCRRERRQDRSGPADRRALSAEGATISCRTALRAEGDNARPRRRL